MNARTISWRLTRVQERLHMQELWLIGACPARVTISILQSKHLTALHLFHARADNEPYLNIYRNWSRTHHEYSARRGALWIHNATDCAVHPRYDAACPVCEAAYTALTCRPIRHAQTDQANSGLHQTSPAQAGVRRPTLDPCITRMRHRINEYSSFKSWSLEIR